MNPGIRAAQFLVVVVVAFLAPTAFSQDTADDDNPLGLSLVRSVEEAGAPQNISTTLTILFLLTILTLAPAILVMTTSFTRIIVVFGFLRQAMATQQSPPNQVLVGLALFLTFFIMMPTWRRVKDDALQT